MKLALQTFTIRKMQKKKPYEAIKKTYEMGFHNFELSRFEFNAFYLKEFKRAKEDFGVHYLNFQKTFECLEHEFEMVIRFCEELECKVVCISVLPLKYILGNEKAINEFCEKANMLYEKYQAKGILVTYHTHDFEYVNVNGFKAIEVIKEKIKTPLIVDAYWLTRAGKNVENVLSELKDKVYGLHLKDYNCTKNMLKRNCEPVALGLGVLDIAHILVCSQGLEYVALEHHSKAPFEEIAISVEYLKQKHLWEVFE